MNIRRPAVRTVALTPTLIAKHRPNVPLCLSSAAVGAGASLASSPDDLGSSETAGVAIVHVLGPLAQREQNDLCGVVMGYDGLALRLCAALTDPGTRSVLLIVDSPGGEVAGLEEAAKRVRSTRDTSGKKIFTYVDELAASAAYWFAALVSDGGIFVPESGAVGSIGAIAIHVDESAALKQAGYKPTIISSPNGKAAANPYEPLSKTGRGRIEKLVGETTDRFIAAIATVRNVPPSVLRDLDGDVVRGAAAIKGRLADGVATLEQVFDRALTAPVQKGGAAVRQENKMGKKAKAAALGLTVEQYKAQKRAAKAGASLTEEDLRVAAMLGVDENKLAAQRAEEIRQRAAGVPVGTFYVGRH